MDQRPDNRSEIRDFLSSRRARLTPQQVGLPTTGRRRIPGLRREEVAVLAGVSTDWYTRLEKGHLGGASEDVIDAVAQALRLDEDERTYLFDLARAARATTRRSTSARRTDAKVPDPVLWLMNSMTLSASFVRNGRSDIVAANPLARALYAPMFDSATTAEHGRANFARYHFLDPGAHHFYLDWDAGAAATVALLRAEAGRAPHNRGLRELIGELSTLSPDFRTLWAQHDVLIHHNSVKRLRHPEVGLLELMYQSFPLPAPAAHDLTTYTAEPGTVAEDQLRLLTSLAAGASPAADPAHHRH